MNYEYDWRIPELARPYPEKYIRDDGRGNSYVPHHVVTQRLIQIFGAPPKIEILREVYDGDVLSGVLMRLTVYGLEPVEEFGEADNPQSKTNGARAKDACSDAIKRCAMRLGNGLHLWAQESYFLFEQLQAKAESTPATAGTGSSQEPSSPPGTSLEVQGDALPTITPEDLFALAGWDEIKPLVLAVLKERAQENHFEIVPRSAEQLGDVSPEALAEVHKRLSGKLAV
jgi:hypothetical protein